MSPDPWKVQLQEAREEAQLKALDQLSEKTGATVSKLIRRAIDEYLKKRQ